MRESTYDLKYATATDIKGPYTRASGPLLQTGDWELHAPGSAGLFPEGKDRFNLAFHARVASEQGKVRAMRTGKLQLKGGSGIRGAGTQVIEDVGWSLFMVWRFTSVALRFLPPCRDMAFCAYSGGMFIFTRDFPALGSCDCQWPLRFMWNS
jgi:hypothetical protein